MIESSIDHCQVPREQIRYLAKNYNTLEYSEALRVMLKAVFKDVDFARCSKAMLHQHINDSVLIKYAGETGLKYQLFRRAARRKLIAAFEVRVQGSRLDFLTLNDVSTSFEIKSELDNLGKLVKQAADYGKVFEYNYAVVDACHQKNVIAMLPASYGIVCFSGGRKLVLRNASLNRHVDPNAQLAMLAKKELTGAFGGLDDRIEIRNRFTDHAINDHFKLALKIRYSSRWNFLVNHRSDILPIDLQFFFKHNLDPALIYNYG